MLRELQHDINNIFKKRVSLSLSKTERREAFLSHLDSASRHMS